MKNLCSLRGTLLAAAIVGQGGVFLAGPAAAAPAANIIYSFQGGTDGAQPVGDLLLGAKGTLIGLTQGGGPGNAGEAFELTPPARKGKPWTKTVLYSFSGAADGGVPLYGLVADATGNFYGTTSAGGANGYGTVFKLSPGKSGYKETVLYDLQPAQFDLGGPLAIDSSGNLYGVSTRGGTAGCGGVFELAPPATGSTAWTVTELHDFSGSDGCYPLERLTFDSSGNLYGTTLFLGGAEFGDVYELQNTKQKWTFTDLHDFSGAGMTGAGPQAGVAFTQNGTMLGTTPGVTASNGLTTTTIFSAKLVKRKWVFSSAGTLDPLICGVPQSRVLIGANNTAYGTGSQPSCAFRVQLGASTAKTQVIGLPPAAAHGGLTSNGNGTLYGATQQGMSGIGFGTIYQLVGTYK